MHRILTKRARETRGEGEEKGKREGVRETGRKYKPKAARNPKQNKTKRRQTD